MALGKRTSSRFLPSVILLVLIAALFGIRGQRVIGAVLGDRAAAPPLATESAEAEETLLALAHRDSLITSAASSWQDPFRPRPRFTRAESPHPRPVRAPEVSPAAPPRLGSLLFDQVRPSVQIRVGDETSDWLHEGETFAGWTVRRITPSSVTLASGTETVVLP